MDGVIIYQSKYGATAQYAIWLSLQLKFPVYETGELDENDLDKFDFVILGSSVYIGKLLIKNWLRKHLSELTNKKIFMFVVCGTPLQYQLQLDTYIESSVPAELKNKSSIYFLPGQLKFKKLSWIDQLKLKVGASLAKSKATKKTMLTDYNNVKKEYLEDIISAINTYKIKDLAGNTKAVFY